MMASRFRPSRSARRVSDIRRARGRVRDRDRFRFFRPRFRSRKAERMPGELTLDPPSFHSRRQQTKRAVKYLFVRGDAVTLVSPPLRT